MYVFLPSRDILQRYLNLEWKCKLITSSTFSSEVKGTESSLYVSNETPGWNI